MLAILLRYMTAITALAGLVLVCIPSLWLDVLMLRPEHAPVWSFVPIAVIIFAMALGGALAIGDIAKSARLVFAGVGIMWGSILYGHQAAFQLSAHWAASAKEIRDGTIANYQSGVYPGAGWTATIRSRTAEAALADAALSGREVFEATPMWYGVLALSVLWFSVGLVSPSQAYIRALKGRIW